MSRNQREGFEWKFLKKSIKSMDDDGDVEADDDGELMTLTMKYARFARSALSWEEIQAWRHSWGQQRLKKNFKKIKKNKKNSRGQQRFL